jgi:alpha-amylase
MTPTEVADTLQPVSAISIPTPISWADEERDITAWLGNELQVAALDKLYSLSGKVNMCEDSLIKKDWEYLQSSDHFYYMATKFFSDGAVHAYFNPYETPYDAFMNYMNVLSDFEIRLKKLFPDTAEQDQIFKLGTQLIERDMIIEKQTIEIEKLNKKIIKINPEPLKAKKKVQNTSKIKTPKVAANKRVRAVAKPLVINGAEGKLATNSKSTKKITPVKAGKKAKPIK